MANGEQHPKIGSLETNSTEYVIISQCQHTCVKNGPIYSVTIHINALNATHARLKFVYGKRTLFEEFNPLEQLDIVMDFKDRPLLVGSGGLVAMYAKTEDSTKPVKVVGAFILREWDMRLRGRFPGVIW